MNSLLRGPWQSYSNTLPVDVPQQFLEKPRHFWTPSHTLAPTVSVNNYKNTEAAFWLWQGDHGEEAQWFCVVVGDKAGIDGKNSLIWEAMRSPPLAISTCQDDCRMEGGGQGQFMTVSLRKVLRFYTFLQGWHLIYMVWFMGIQNLLPPHQHPDHGSSQRAQNSAWHTVGAQ